MKTISLLILFGLTLAAKSQKQIDKRPTMTVITAFPKKEHILPAEFSSYDNFFPIATVEIKSKESVARIHIVYTFFQGTYAEESYFLKDEYGGSFSFAMEGDLCLPTFKKEALKIDEDYMQFLEEANKKYQSVNKLYPPIEFLAEPEWWQGDETPLSKDGRKMKFICQVDLADIVDDDCRMFIFYDSGANKVKTVYQRD